MTNPDYYQAFHDMEQTKRDDLAKCFLWAARYGKNPPQQKSYYSDLKDDRSNNRYYWIWDRVDLWQYEGSEKWTDQNPSQMKDQAVSFPIASAGSVIPFDCNYVPSPGYSVTQLWNDHGWIALPSAP
jgi:hypothetical protein